MVLRQENDMKKKVLRILTLGFLLVLVLIGLVNVIVENSTAGRTYDQTDAIPKNRVGLVLGTSSKQRNGEPNPYYEYRIEATLALYKAGKIDYVLVSGDNGTKYYNEPITYKKDLVAGGIPENRIFLDAAGFRTLDSMVRAKYIFGLDSVTVISQEFHNKRAIFLAERKGLTAIGYNAKDLSGIKGLKMHARESLARVKVFIDLLLNTQPKYYGKKIEIR